jgi:drug/metabolite transporter (DMT)-like permease
MANKTKAIFLALAAAFLYSLSAPLSKMLMAQFSPSYMAGLLYLGAGLGMIPLCLSEKSASRKPVPDTRKITRQDFPYIVLMVLFDVAAPILLMLSLSKVPASNISLINNFEIAATSLIAFYIFKEKISKRLWLGIFLVSAAGFILSFEVKESLSFSPYSVFAFLACIIWGFENNCTKKLSECNPSKIVIIKGLGSGSGAILVALIAGEKFHFSALIIPALLLGFFSYGLSVFTYIRAQRFLGAAKTSAYYSINPFIGSLLSVVLYREFPGFTFCLAFLIMALGTWIITRL